MTTLFLLYVLASTQINYSIVWMVKDRLYLTSFFMKSLNILTAMPVIMLILIKSKAELFVPFYVPITGCLIGAALALLLHFYVDKSTT